MVLLEKRITSQSLYIVGFETFKFQNLTFEFPLLIMVNKLGFPVRVTMQ